MTRRRCSTSVCGVVRLVGTTGAVGVLAHAWDARLSSARRTSLRTPSARERRTPCPLCACTRAT